MIYFSCPTCHKIAEASDGLAGSLVACPDCHTRMTVPRAPGSPRPAVLPVSAFPDGKLRFLCPACRKRLRVPADAVGSITVCRRCGQRMQVPEPPLPGAEELPPPVPLPGIPKLPSQYFYVKNDQRLGPVFATELKQLAERGQLLPTDLIWKKGMPRWIAARKLRGLFTRPARVPAPSAPPPTQQVELSPLAGPPPTVPISEADRTIIACTETLRQDARNVAAHIKRGMAYAEKSDYHRALSDLNEALRLEPRNAQAYASRGVIQAQLKQDYAQAVADLTRAIQYAPEEVVLYEFRGLFYRALGDTARADADERHVKELRPRGTASSLAIGRMAPAALMAPLVQGRGAQAKG